MTDSMRNTIIQQAIREAETRMRHEMAVLDARRKQEQQQQQQQQQPPATARPASAPPLQPPSGIVGASTESLPLADWNAHDQSRPPPRSQSGRIYSRPSSARPASASSEGGATTGSKSERPAAVHMTDASDRLNVMKHDVDAKNSSSVSRPASAPPSRAAVRAAAAAAAAEGGRGRERGQPSVSGSARRRTRPASAAAAAPRPNGSGRSALDRSTRDSLSSLGIAGGSSSFSVDLDASLDATDLSHTVHRTRGGVGRLYTHDRPFSSMEAWSTNVKANKPFKALVRSDISAIPERKPSSVVQLGGDNSDGDSSVTAVGPAVAARRRSRRPSSAASRASSTTSRVSGSASTLQARRRRLVRRAAKSQSTIPFSNLHAPNGRPFSEAPSLAGGATFAKMLRSVPTRGPTDRRGSRGTYVSVGAR